MTKRKSVSCFDQACRFLALRDHSSHELAKKLLQKGFTNAQIDEAIASLSNSGYIDEEAYALRYGSGRINRIGLGPMRVRLDLIRKGFSGAIVEKTVATLFAKPEEEIKRSIEIAQKKARTFKADTNKEVMKKRLYDFLVRKGYSAETARTVALNRFEELFGDSESPDE